LFYVLTEEIRITSVLTLTVTSYLHKRERVKFPSWEQNYLFYFNSKFGLYFRHTVEAFYLYKDLFRSY